MPPNLLSYHLKVLRDAGLVTATRRGRRIEYALDRVGLARLRAAVPLPTETGAGRPSTVEERSLQTLQPTLLLVTGIAIARLLWDLLS